MRWLILISIAVWPAFAVAQEARQIVVTASGSASAVPDMAVVQIGVTREAETATEAMGAASTAVARVLDTVAAAGVEPRDVQTASISLYPVHDQASDRTPVIRGYVASNDLTIRVRDLKSLGELLDKVVSEGANTMNGLTFAVSDPEPVQKAARTAAVEEARKRAETLAAAGWVKLGPVQKIEESGGFSGPGPMMRETMMEASVPVAEGELDFVVTVTVVFGVE